MSATGKLDRPGGSLHFEIIDATPPWAAEAPLILFHHGIGATADVWAEWLPPLLDRYRIARFDTLGFGRSGVPGPGFPWSLEGLMADALEVAGPRAPSGSTCRRVGGRHRRPAAGKPASEALLSLTVSNASHRGGSIQRAREWRSSSASTAWPGGAR